MRHHTVTQFGRNRGSEVHLDLAGAIWNRNTISRAHFCSRTAQNFKLKFYFDEKSLWLVFPNPSWFPNRPLVWSTDVVGADLHLNQITMEHTLCPLTLHIALTFSLHHNHHRIPFFKPQQPPQQHVTFAPGTSYGTVLLISTSLITLLNNQNRMRILVMAPEMRVTYPSCKLHPPVPRSPCTCRVRTTSP